MRIALWALAGVVLGLIIHIGVILGLPRLAPEHLWDTISELDALGHTVTLSQPALGAPNPLALDPEMAYAVCQFDLSKGPGVFSGELPSDFWSIGIFDREGIAVYSTTNRSGVGKALELGVFNPEQTRLLAQQQFEIDEGLLIVEAPSNDIFAVVRLAVPYPEMRGRYTEALSQLQCGHIAPPSADGPAAG